MGNTDAIVSTRLTFRFANLQMVNRCGRVLGNMLCHLICSVRLYFFEVLLYIWPCYFNGVENGPRYNEGAEPFHRDKDVLQTHTG